MSRFEAGHLRTHRRTRIPCKSRCLETLLNGVKVPSNSSATMLDTSWHHSISFTSLYLVVSRKIHDQPKPGKPGKPRCPKSTRAINTWQGLLRLKLCLWTYDNWYNIKYNTMKMRTYYHMKNIRLRCFRTSCTLCAFGIGLRSWLKGLEGHMSFQDLLYIVLSEHEMLTLKATC